MFKEGISMYEYEEKIFQNSFLINYYAAIIHITVEASSGSKDF